MTILKEQKKTYRQFFSHFAGLKLGFSGSTYFAHGQITRRVVVKTYYFQIIVSHDREFQTDRCLCRFKLKFLTTL